MYIEKDEGAAMRSSRRLHPRIEAPIRIIVSGAPSHLLDISQGGFRILAASEAMDRLAAGAAIDCTMELPIEPCRSLQVAARVVRRIDTPAGVELATHFVGLSDDDRLTLASFIDQVLANALLAADRARTAFLHGMSHEIRTPLNAIIGFSQLGLTSAQGESKHSGYFANIRRAGDQMLEFLDGLLRLAACEAALANGSNLPRGEQIASLLVGAVITAAPIAKREEVAVHVDMPEGNPIILVALEPLREIVNGLVRGAIAEAGPKGVVTLSCDAPHANIRIRVKRGGAAKAPRDDLADYTAWNAPGGGGAMAALYLTAVQNVSAEIGIQVERIAASADIVGGFELSLAAATAITPERLAS
jgi:signal transduction histidine kinase